MAVNLDNLTTQEQIDVLERALFHLRTPERWCQGEWVCTIPNYAKGGTMQAYCLEGAINQATVDLFGESRARELGAWDDYDGIRTETGRTPTQIISLNDTVIALYPSEIEEWMASRPNEDSDFAAMVWQDQEGRTWEDVTGLLRGKLDSLRTQVA